MDVYSKSFPFLSDLSDFIKINGKTLKILYIGGNPSDMEYLEEYFCSIRDNCENLEHLTTIYNDRVDQRLTEISIKKSIINN